MVYSYRCLGCEALFVVVAGFDDARNDVACSECGGVEVKRDYRTDRPRMNPVWPDHFNPSVGKRIHSKRELNEALKLKSDEMSKKTGIEHNYVARSAADISDTIK